jgi:rod shape-determining protein MreB
MPKTITLTTGEVRAALSDPLQAIIDAVRATLERTPPELAADIARHGIMLAGGGSLLDGFEQRLAEETQMPTYLASSPLTCVALGAGYSLEEFDALTRSSNAASGRRRGAASARA